MTTTAERIHRALARIESLLLEKSAVQRGCSPKETDAADIEAIRARMRDEIVEHASAEDVLVLIAAYVVLVLAAREIAYEAHE